MIDQRMINRALYFKSNVTNIQKYREERSLTLRKEKIFEHIMNKRMENLELKYNEDPQTFIEIDPKDLNYMTNTILSESINIPEEDLANYNKIEKKKKVEILKKFLVIRDSRGYNYTNFAIYHLKLFFRYNFQSIPIRTALIDEELCQLVLNEILIAKDLAAICDLGYILTQMTYYSEKACELFLDREILKQFIELALIDNSGIKENIFITVGNILTHNKDFVLNNTDFIIVLTQMITKMQSVLTKSWYSGLRIAILWNMNIITKGMSNDELGQFEFLVPILKAYLKAENIKEIKEQDKTQEEINQILEIIAKISLNDVVIESLITNGLVDDLVYLLQYLNIPYSKELRYDPNQLITLTPCNFLLALNIISNIFCGSDSSLTQHKVLTSELIEMFGNLLMRYRFFNKKEEKKTLKEIIWVLSNIMAGPSQHADFILSTDIPRNLLLFYGTKDESIFSEILWFFYQALIKGSKSATIAILKLNFIKFIFECIISTDKHEVIEKCLQCISSLLKFSKEIDYSVEQNNLNPILRELLKYPIIARLEQLSIHNNKDISYLSKTLLEEVEIMVNKNEIMN